MLRDRPNHKTILPGYRDIHWVFDDFDHGLDTNRWDASILTSGAGSNTMTNQAGGVLKLASGNGGSAGFVWKSGNLWARDKSVVQEWRVKLGQTANVTAIEFGIADATVQEGITFIYETAVSANWQIVKYSGGTPTKVSTGTAAGTSWAVFRVEEYAGSALVYVNDTLALTETTGLPALATQRDLLISVDGDTTNDVNIELDYVYAGSYRE